MQIEYSLPIAALAVFLAKEIYSFIKESNNSIQKNIIELNYSINELRLRFDELNRHLDEIPRLKASIENAHNKIRELTNS